MGKRMKGEERKKGKEPESTIILDFGVEEKKKKNQEKERSPDYLGVIGVIKATG